MGTRQEWFKNQRVSQDIPDLKVTEPENNTFYTALNCRTYRLMKKSTTYDAYVTDELHRMTEKTAVHMKNRTFSGENLMSIMAFLQELKRAYDACNIHGGAAMWVFKQFLASPAEAALKSRICLPNSISSKYEGPLQSHSSIVQLLLERYATVDNIATPDNKICGLQQGLSSPPEFPHKLCTKTLVCGSICDEKKFKDIFVENIKASIWKLLLH